MNKTLKTVRNTNNYENNAARKTKIKLSDLHIDAKETLREHMAAHCTPWEQVDPSRALGRLLWSRKLGQHLRNRASAHHRSWPHSCSFWAENDKSNYKSQPTCNECNEKKKDCCGHNMNIHFAPGHQ